MLLPAFANKGVSTPRAFLIGVCPVSAVSEKSGAFLEGSGLAVLGILDLGTSGWTPAKLLVVRLGAAQLFGRPVGRRPRGS
jgi:hypothetical protein